LRRSGSEQAMVSNKEDYTGSIAMACVI